MSAISIGEVQTLLRRLIAAPSGVATEVAEDSSLGPRLNELIVSDERLSAVERVDIYANMYFYRLLDALKEDFPATLAVVGDANFHNLITSYLLEFPPTEPSIIFAGQYLASFISTHEFSRQLPFLSDLAALERTLIEVFHAPDSTPLAATTLKQLGPEQWPDMSLRRVAALRLVNVGWRVAEVLRAIEEGRRWEAPERRDLSVLVWRKRNRVFYRDLDALEAAALDLLTAPIKFGDLCECVADACGDSATVEAIAKLLNRWLDNELLAA